MKSFFPPESAKNNFCVYRTRNGNEIMLFLFAEKINFNYQEEFNLLLP